MKQAREKTQKKKNLCRHFSSGIEAVCVILDFPFYRKKESKLREFK